MTSDGIVTTIAGSTRGSSGDGGPATSGQMVFPWFLGIDEIGTMYIADNQAPNVRAVDLGGTISTAGGPELTGVSEPGLDRAFRLAVSPEGDVFVWNSVDNSVRRRNPSGVVSMILGGDEVGQFQGMGTGMDGSLYVFRSRPFNGDPNVKPEPPGVIKFDPAGALSIHAISGVDTGTCLELSGTPYGPLYLPCGDALYRIETAPTGRAQP
jgi:hypothetical protein